MSYLYAEAHRLYQIFLEACGRQVPATGWPSRQFSHFSHRQNLLEHMG